MELFSVAEKALKKSKELGSTDCSVSASLIESKEFNIETGKISLLRTLFDQNISVKSILLNKQGLSTGNQFSEEGILSTALKAYNSAHSSSEIIGAGFADNQGQHEFNVGDFICDDDWIYDQLQNLIEETQERFPKVILNHVSVKFVNSNAISMSSKGTFFKSRQSYYQGFVFFNSKDKSSTSSFNYMDFIKASKKIKNSEKIMNTNHLSELLRQSQEQLKVKKVPSKFNGDLILTPHCLSDFARGLLSYMGSSQMIKKTSPFFNQKNNKVISNKLTIQACPVSNEFPINSFWNSDGYLSKNEVLFEDGVLKNYLLDHQASAQLNENVSLSGGSHIKIKPGHSSLEEMICSVKKGILLCRFSAGQPAANGDISGVAKNSYYIEDGKIQFPLSETMISMNLFELFNNVNAVSAEALNSGSTILPWIHMTGASIS